MNEIEEMKADLVTELANMLMSNDANISMEQALEYVFNSETYQKLLDNKTQLYYQSAGYVMSYLQNELLTGKMG
ncbi:MAG: hypothetical protein HXL35_09615 [Prevotellaceae bacterium]|jgi:hypothetical protein|nr:hypothetical protein [Prevotellaceae bacterium]